MRRRISTTTLLGQRCSTSSLIAAPSRITITIYSFSTLKPGKCAKIRKTDAPWAQKGTGRARAGDLKRPQDRSGGVAHGPVVRSHAIEMPKKVRKLALKMALSAKAKEGKLVILDDAKAKDHKTKPMAKALDAFGFKSALIVCGQEVDTNFARATRNLPRLDVVPGVGANVYDILRRDTLFLTKDAVNELTEKLKG